MKWIDDKGQNVKFVKSDPPFEYDPNHPAVIKKVAYANKVGLGKVPKKTKGAKSVENLQVSEISYSKTNRKASDSIISSETSTANAVVDRDTKPTNFPRKVKTSNRHSKSVSSKKQTSSRGQKRKSKK